jgi:hypothetical protein
VHAGADDFLPILIFVTVRANPPRLASNLEYIQRYRMQSRMMSEAAYFFTQMVRAENHHQSPTLHGVSLAGWEMLCNADHGAAERPRPQHGCEHVSGTIHIVNHEFMVKYIFLEILGIIQHDSTV